MRRWDIAEMNDDILLIIVEATFEPCPFKNTFLWVVGMKSVKN